MKNDLYTGEETGKFGQRNTREFGSDVIIDEIRIKTIFMRVNLGKLEEPLNFLYQQAFKRKLIIYH
jgi:hypothetical protein